MPETDGDKPFGRIPEEYRGCPLFEESGACFCSTGVLGNCAMPDLPGAGGRDER